MYVVGRGLYFLELDFRIFVRYGIHMVQPFFFFLPQKYLFLWAQKTSGILGALSSGGHILATRSISLFLYLYQSVSPTICTLSFPPSISLYSTFPFILPSLNISLSVSFPTICLSFLSSIHPSSVSQCIKMPHLDPFSAHTLQFPLPRSDPESISSALWRSICLSFHCSVCLSKEINRLSQPPSEECLFVMISQDKRWGESRLRL